MANLYLLKGTPDAIWTVEGRLRTAPQNPRQEWYGLVADLSEGGTAVFTSPEAARTAMEVWKGSLPGADRFETRITEWRRVQ